MWPDSKPRENVWLGTSIANQSNADEYVPRLLEVKNLCRFVFLSVEPQIGPVDLSPWISQLDWVIIGGESQQGKEQPRPFRVQWARYLVRQCREANVPCFVKQLGSNAWDGPRKLDLKDSHGGDMAEWEPGLRVRECPESITQIAW
jgi:protein gp37